MLQPTKAGAESRYFLRTNGHSPTKNIVHKVKDAVQMLELAYGNLEFDVTGDEDRKAHIVALASRKGGCWWLGIEMRARYREEGRFSNAPATEQQADPLAGRGR